MISLKTDEEIAAIGRAGDIIARLFEELPARIRPGVSTAELDTFADSFIRDHEGASPAFKGLYGFPASICISVNEEVVHGIPTAKRRLIEGDIVTPDVGVKLDGWFADASRTFAVGEIDATRELLLEVTRSALDLGIAQAVVGNRVGDIGHAVQTAAEGAGFSVVRELVGHGLGRAPHEEPNVPNWGRPGKGVRLRAGMVIAIEPMVNLGRPEIVELDDGWTVVTSDRLPSAHFENTVAVTEGGPRILTAVNGARPAQPGPPATL